MTQVCVTIRADSEEPLPLATITVEQRGTGDLSEVLPEVVADAMSRVLAAAGKPVAA